MEECIKEARGIIRSYVTGRETLGGGKAFDDYGSVYFWTNENVNQYLKFVSFEGKTSALSVLASGDHAFNLITNGVNNIDTFDTNLLTEYIALGLKRAMILKFSYEEFLSAISELCFGDVSIEFYCDLINSLFPYMERRMQIFWQSVLEYNYKIQKNYGTNLNLLKMLCINIEILGYKTSNNYLLNRDNYNLLRSRLASANITFKCANAISLPEEFSGKYDFILLSNILDYVEKYWGGSWEYCTLKSYEEKLQNIVKNDGVIFLQYILYYAGLEPELFFGSEISKNDLEDEEIIPLTSEFLGLPTGIILKRIKSGDK